MVHVCSGLHHFPIYSGNFGSVVCCSVCLLLLAGLVSFPRSYWFRVTGSRRIKFCVLYPGNGCGSISAKINLICSICICHTIRIIVPSSAISRLFPLNFQPNNKWSVHFTSSRSFPPPFLFIPLNLKPLVSKLAPHLENLMLMTIINPK